MSNFWQNRLGTAPAQQAPTPPSNPSPLPWWQQTAIPTPGRPQPTPGPQPEQPGVPALQQQFTEEYRPRQAKSLQSNEICGECGSGNVFRPQANAMLQCYECGANSRFSHSTAGLSGIKGEDTGPPTPSRQVSTANNYQPTKIIATVK